MAEAIRSGTETAARLFDELVDRTQEWLAGGEAEGVRPTGDPRARAVTYVSGQLAPLVLGDQVGRLLGGDTAETATAVRGAGGTGDADRRPVRRRPLARSVQHRGGVPVRALLVTHGTRGDVQPFLSPAVAVRGRGREAVLAAPASFAAAAAE